MLRMANFRFDFASTARSPDLEDTTLPVGAMHTKVIVIFHFITYLSQFLRVCVCERETESGRESQSDSVREKQSERQSSLSHTHTHTPADIHIDIHIQREKEREHLCV